MTCPKRVFMLAAVPALLAVQPQFAFAETVSVTTCAQADVQAAIDAVSAGGTVTIPPGQCTWTSGVDLQVSKRITIRGSGPKTTLIRMSPAGTAVWLRRSGSRVTGIGFIDGTVNADGNNWRIDHNAFTSTSFLVGVHANGANSPQDFPIGLVDHNEFRNMRVVTFGGDLMAHPEWFFPYRPGSGDAVYIEDNTFTFTVFGNAVDCNYGGRFVFRHNIVKDAWVEAHSVQGQNRACRSWEIYNNTISQISRAMFTPVFLRGGTGVVFNNIIEGQWGFPAITVDNVRSFATVLVAGRCDGTSLWDGNQEANGYPCRDQIGRSADTALSTTALPFARQALDPMYAWDNLHGSTTVTIRTHNDSHIHIKEGRDYFSNVHRPGYAPYSYPHPLTFGLSAPQNLRIVAR